MGFINQSNDTAEYAEVAALLVAMAREQDIHPRDIITFPHGFMVPDSLSDALVAPEARKTPPPGWDEPLAPVDVEFGADGRVYLTPEAAATLEPVEVVYGTMNLDADMVELVAPVEDEPKVTGSEIRNWAKEQGIEVPARGKLPQSVVDAFYVAHSGE